MDASLPSAKSACSPGEREKLQRIIAERDLGGLANDTKWDEFIQAMRACESWRPSYRYKCVDGRPSTWDVEWHNHLPFPFLSVEWFDISLMQSTHRGMLIPPLITDHSPWIVDLLRRISFEFQQGTTMIRIFGYSPKSLDLFDL